jgi:shikimate dehydrogenase
MRLAVVGDPIEHSLSPLMHTAALEVLEGLDSSLDRSRYEAWHARVEDLPLVLARAEREALRGMNFTLPHKLAVLDLAARVAPSAAAVGAANTLVKTEAGWEAHNTDAEGFWSGLSELRRGHGAPVEEGWLGTAVVLGSGGASRAVVHAIETRAPEAQILQVSRRPETLRSGSRTTPLDYRRLGELEPEAQLWVNTTTVGMAGGPTEFPVELPLNCLGQGDCVVDIVYPRPTGGLLDQAEMRGAWVQSGLAMLLWQGVLALELWTGKTLPEAAVEAMRGTLRDPERARSRYKLGGILHVG